MPDSFVFPYKIVLRENGAIDIVPIAEVGFKTKDGEMISLFLIIDSGATISVLPKSDAKSLGVNIEKGKPVMISGIGGEKIGGWLHQIKVWLKEIPVNLPTVFLGREIGPRVLGRAGIFENFLIVFQEKRKRTGFLKEGKREAGVIQKILDRVQSPKL